MYHQNGRFLTCFRCRVYASIPQSSVETTTALCTKHFTVICTFVNLNMFFFMCEYSVLFPCITSKACCFLTCFSYSVLSAVYYLQLHRQRGHYYLSMHQIFLSDCHTVNLIHEGLCRKPKLYALLKFHHR